MKEIDFDVTLRVGELFSFTMRHTYCSISGVFSLVLSLGCLLACVLNLGQFQTATILALLVIASLFTVIQPIMLYGKCRAQIRKSDSINAALHYTLTEEGIVVSQAEQRAEVSWGDIRKVVRAKRGLYVYMSPVRAFIFPEEQCGGQYEEICLAVAEQTKKHRED